MKLDREFEEFESEIKDLKERLQKMEDSLEKTKENTYRFLNICEKIGIKIVAINTKTDLIKSCSRWNSGRGNAFADEKTEDDFPAIWEAVKVYDNTTEDIDGKLGVGCGNTGQYQINSYALLMDGVYILEDGRWIKVVDEK